MFKGRDLMPVLDKFLGTKQKSSVAQDARVQIRTPDGRLYDIVGVNLVENKILGARETHRLVITTHEEEAKISKQKLILQAAVSIII